MVLYFTSNVVSPPATIFMGADKYENEELIKWGFPEDVWFHVDKVSSAHVYLRLQSGQTLDDISPELLEDCVQLVKANSILGNKMNNIDIVYTMWTNLKKTNNMEVGQVGFHKQKEVRTVHVPTRLNEIVNRLNKTKLERQVDLRTEREDCERQEREEKKKRLREIKDKEKEEVKMKKEMAALQSYESLMKTDKMISNKDTGNDSDDFM